MRIRVVILFLLSTSVLAFGQTDWEHLQIRQKRYRNIHLHHIGIGGDVTAYRNIHLSPRIYYGYGSYRNLFNVDVGVFYRFSCSLSPQNADRVLCQYVAPFVSTAINAYRWNTGSLYIGCEAAYNFAVAADYYSRSDKKLMQDIYLGRDFCSIKPKFGVRFDKWEININCEYDLAPSLNQKYIFESVRYDYEQVRTSLFERYRFGISAAYLIPF